MKIIILHWHGTCPHCGKESCIYMDFVREEDYKYPDGYICELCSSHITNEEFDNIKDIRNARREDGICGDL
jgi:phage terminase large subunit GpA-like protein